jgi:hypothetical protein
MVKERLLAILDHDNIKPVDHLRHLMRRCNISRYMANKLLDGRLPKSAIGAYEIADGLDVHFAWLVLGSFEIFHPRTARIQMVTLDGDSETDADALIDGISTDIPNEPRFAYFGPSLPNGRKFRLSDLIMLEQRRRMTPWEQNRHYRFLLRILNNDPKARRLSEMVNKGQITRRQFFEAM